MKYINENGQHLTLEGKNGEPYNLIIQIIKKAISLLEEDDPGIEECINFLEENFSIDT